jgi:hypothetical protein
MTKHQNAPLRFPRRLEPGSDMWKEIAGLDLSQIQESSWVIENFLADRSTQLCYGAFGTSKTTALLKAAWSVSQGIPFLGMKTEQRAVLYLDYENPADVLKSYCLGLGINPSSPWLKIWDRAAEHRVPLPISKRLQRFIQRCKTDTGKYPWIIFDSWTSLEKEDENQGHKVSKVFREIRSLCDMGVTCTVIDHTPKASPNSQTAVGSYAKMTQMDTSHSFESVDEQTDWFNLSRSRKVYRVTSFLKRYAPKGVGTFSFEVEGEEDEKGRWRISSLERTNDQQEVKNLGVVEKMKSLIRYHPTLGKKAIATLAADKEHKIVKSRNVAYDLLEQGIAAKAWESVELGKSHKQVFRVLKGANSSLPGPKEIKIRKRRK